MAGDIKWIKITVDMFDDEKIDFISSLPEGDSLIVIWVRLLTMAGKNNAGGFIFLTEKIPYTQEMLSHKFKKPLNVIRLAMETFKKLNMIELVEAGNIFISNWEKHQNLDALEKIREKTRIRVANYRSKAKQIQCNVTETGGVTPSNATEQELEQELELEQDKKNKRVSPKEKYSFSNYTTNNDLIVALDDFVLMRKKIKAPMTEKAVRLMLSKLEAISSSDEEKIAILNQSIMNSWKGIFELKDNSSRARKQGFTQEGHKVKDYSDEINF